VSEKSSLPGSGDSDPAPQSGAAPAADAESIARLFSEHNRALVGYLVSRLRSEQEAKEVAQEAYVRMLQLDKLGTPSLLRAYLFRTAANIAVDRLRRRNTLQRIEASDLFREFNTPDANAYNPEHAVLQDETERQLQSCLGELPKKCREIFVLHRLGGLGQQDVASKSGCSERMVRRYVTYALVYCRLRMNGMTAEEAKERVEL
jgi:RNA polymerase sigma-70 factor (ECF subfamily)